MITVKRDWIKNQIEKGNLMIKTDMKSTDNYILFDGYAAYNSEKDDCQEKGWKVAVIKEFDPTQFGFQGGYAYKNDDNTICWVIMRGLIFTFKLKTEAAR